MIQEFKETFRELAAKKRAEVEASLEAGLIADPFSSTIIASILISSAISAASYVLSLALAPKPPKQTIGKLQGALQLMNSEQGIFIPEIYGTRPVDGKGGIKVPAIIVWSSGIRKIVTTTSTPASGGKGFGGRSQTVENISYNIDLGMMFSRGPVSLLREYGNADILIDQYGTGPSGAYDPGTGADATYDPLEPPDPTIAYSLSTDRVNSVIVPDGDGVSTGTIQGGGATFAIYPGNTDQQPDPTIEADIDAQYGAGSTPAFRNHSLIVHSQFSLSRWGGTVPNITAVWEHQDLSTLDDIYASMCERVNVLTANGDYDLSGLSTIECRGMLVAGRPYAPAEVIDSEEIKLAYNYFVTEKEGQLVGYIEGTEPSVTIPDTEIGWLESDAELPDIAPEVSSVLAAEILLPRQVHVKYLDPDNNWEPNTQSAIRQITDGVSVEMVDVQLALTADEARTTAQRKLYRDYVGGTAHKFTLPWTYLYLYPGYKIIITRAEGFTHTLRLTSITGSVGLLECEGIALEPSVFTQPADGVYPPGYIPPQAVPAMTIVQLLDTPLLRDGDETNNYGIGFYMAGVPRTATGQTWTGFTLYVNRNGTWTILGDSNLPATVGKIVSVTGLNTTDTSVFDRTGVFTVDLYGTTATLESITELDMVSDASRNMALVGDMLIQFGTATQIGGFPNRWEISILLNGRRGTDRHVTDTFTDKRFVLINNAVKFVPMTVADINNNMEFRAVTIGQSLGDAAIVQFAWAGGTLQPIAPGSVRGVRDSGDDLMVLWNRRTRVGAGMIPFSDVPVAEEKEEYLVQYPDAVPVRSQRVLTGMQLAAFLEGSGATQFDGITHNSLTPASATSARTMQEITQSGNMLEGTLQLDPTSGGMAMIGLQISAGDWRTTYDDVNTARSTTGLVVKPWPTSATVLLNDYYVPTIENGHKYKVTTGGTTGATESTWPTGAGATVASGSAVFTEDGSTLLAGAAAMPYLVILEALGSGGTGFWQRLYVYSYGMRIFNASSKTGQADYDPDFGWVAAFLGDSLFRVKFNLVGSSVRIQKTHRADVPYTTITTGTRPVDYPIVGVAGADGGSNQVLGMVQTINPQPATIYSAAEQAQDGLTPGDPVRVRVAQISAIGGAGPWAEATV